MWVYIKRLNLKGDLMNKIELNKFYEGSCDDAYQLFGAHFEHNNGVDGVRFCVYAPNARSIRVVGDFNEWYGDHHYMEKYNDDIFTLFIANVKEYSKYKYLIEKQDYTTHLKSDPYAFYSEVKPQTASVVFNLDNYHWNDQSYMEKRTKNFDKPMNIYELYASGFMRHPDGSVYSYEQLADVLIPYCRKNGYTHIELMPLNEYPFDGSWGYQPTGFFSATSRYGNPCDFMYFIDRFHQANIGVILDVVMVHYVKDAHGLRYFDGGSVYEYDNENALSQWDSMNFNLHKEEVRSFLISVSAFWCDKFHIDGLRVDAVSNIIYWDGNSSRGENTEAINFIKRHNHIIADKYQTVMLIAEDSSSYPGVTKATIDGGLGFDYKWDLGFMNDTLKYYSLPLDVRKDHHHKLTFSMAYFYSERFILPFSHDEVVHGKKTIIDKMWGTYDEKFALCKNLYLYMYTHPGKKLNFMGNEFAMFREFDEKRELDWFILENERHNSFNRFMKDLNLIYLSHPALSKYDYQHEGFMWIDADNNEDSVYIYKRIANDEEYIVVVNNSYKSFNSYIINNINDGEYFELINSEKDIYYGCNMCNYYPMQAKDNKLDVRIAPFSAFILKKV